MIAETPSTPPPSPAAESAAGSETLQLESQQSGFGPVAGESRDRDGKPFDPAIHTGKKDANGRWERIGGPRKPGRPPGSKSATKPAESKGKASAEPPAPSFADVEAIAAAPAEPEPGEDRKPASEVKDAKAVVENATAETAIGIIQTALVLLGDEEGLLSPVEKELMRGPLVRVLQKYEVAPDAMPPEIDLAVVCASLVIARLKKPKTATAFVKLKTWALGLFFRRKGAQLAAQMQEHVTTSP